MGKKMTWEEMQQQFPNEWLRIIDFDVDEVGHLVAGIVDRHSKDKDVVYRLPALHKPTAFRYTGAVDICWSKKPCGNTSHRLIRTNIISTSSVSSQMLTA